jgi:hypothetical protein
VRALLEYDTRTDGPRMQQENNELIMLGWREHVAIPDWGIRRIGAKIDTGARTSAVHVGEIEHISEDRIRFEVIYRVRPTHKGRWVEADLVRKSSVKPSSGVEQERPVVMARIRIGEIEREVEVSLVCRKNMRCRMLVGRTALNGVFCVDPSKRYLADPRKQPNEGNTA